MRDRVSMGWCSLRARQIGAFKHSLKSTLGRVEITCGIKGGPCFGQYLNPKLGSTYMMATEPDAAG